MFTEPYGTPLTLFLLRSGLLIPVAPIGYAQLQVVRLCLLRKEELFLTRRTENALIWNLDLAKTSPSPIQYVLRGHNRSVTDINFSSIV